MTHAAPTTIRTMKSLGFRPAFLDYATMTIYPTELAGSVLVVRATLIPGFERHGFFYTRTAAARAAMEWSSRRDTGRHIARS